ncbi:MAG: outer membrane beta-barrel protein [Terracidiphilus sp.]
MRSKMRTGIFLIGLASAAGLAARAQTSVALSVYGAFNGATSGNGVAESPSNAAGGIVELRHISNPFVGYEASYSFNRANQAYTGPPSTPLPCAVDSCPVLTGSVPANAHEFTGDWVVSLRVTNVRPFALAGGGVIVDAPTTGAVPVASCSPITALCVSSSASTSTSAKAVFVYGAGLDWGLLPHLGLRLQYRGNLYKAPELTSAFSSTNAFTHTAEPMLGAYFRF